MQKLSSLSQIAQVNLKFSHNGGHWYLDETCDKTHFSGFAGCVCTRGRLDVKNDQRIARIYISRWQIKPSCGGARKNKTKQIQHNLSRDILINTSKSPINTSAWIIAIYKNNTSRLWLASVRTISPRSLVFDASVCVSLYSLTRRVSFLCAPGNQPLYDVMTCLTFSLQMHNTHSRYQLLQNECAVRCVCMQKSLWVLG